MNNIGIGLDGAIIEKSSHSTAKKFFNMIKAGQVSYLFIALRVLFQKKAFKVLVNRFTVYNRAFLFVLSKHPYFGGGIQIAPHASNQNELIELVEIDKIPQKEFFGLLKKLLKVQHMTDPRVKTQSAKSFEIRVTSEQPMQIDGEAYTLPANTELIINSEKRTIIQ